MSIVGLLKSLPIKVTATLKEGVVRTFLFNAAYPKAIFMPFVAAVTAAFLKLF